MSQTTPELFKQALDTAHNSCEKGCTHADAEFANIKAIEEKIGEGMMSPLFLLNPLLASFSLGVHVGYRLHQLETEPISKEAN